MKTESKENAELVFPDLKLAQQAAKDFSTATWLGGMDEVGRGAIAGPVAVGVASMHRSRLEESMVEETAARMPAGLRDSKLLTAKKRIVLAPLAREWVECAVGYASAVEIDEYGIMNALRLAARRALVQLAKKNAIPQMLILDGPFNWFTWPASLGNYNEDPLALISLSSVSAQRELDSISAACLLGVESSMWEKIDALPVRCVVKGDQKCALVASAAVVAKVARDSFMEDIAPAYADYHWEKNKGYASKQHMQAIMGTGLSDEHRKSWKISGRR